MGKWAPEGICHSCLGLVGTQLDYLGSLPSQNEALDKSLHKRPLCPVAIVSSHHGADSHGAELDKSGMRKNYGFSSKTCQKFLTGATSKPKENCMLFPDQHHDFRDPCPLTVLNLLVHG